MLTLKAHPVRLSGARWLGPRHPRLAQADTGAAEIEKTVNALASSLVATASQLNGDLEKALDPELYAEVPVVGETLTQVQVIEAVDAASRSLADLIVSILTPPLGPYVTPASAELLTTATSDMEALQASAAEIIAEVEEPLTSGETILVDDYIGAYLDPLREARQNAEKLVVQLENGQIPVLEEGEKSEAGLWKVALVGGIVVGLIALGTASATEASHG